MAIIYILCLVVTILIPGVTNLKCHVCQDQTETTGKCDTTVESCSIGEGYYHFPRRSDSTSSLIGPPMQLYESMRCATKEDCNGSINDMEPCPTPLRKDWTCKKCCDSDCCHGNITACNCGTVSQNLKLMLILVAGMLAM